MSRHPARAVEIALAVLAGLLLVVLSWCWGAPAEAGAGLGWGAGFGLLFLGLQAVWWMLQHDVVRLRWWTLAPLPWLLWITGRGWLAGEGVGSEAVRVGWAWVAYAVFWVASHSLRTRTAQQALLWSWGVAWAAVLGMVGYQLYGRPEWLAGELERSLPGGFVPAAGPFLSPTDLAVSLLAFVPLAGAVACFPRYGFAVRGVAASLALVLGLAALGSGQWIAVLALGLVAILLPIIVLGGWKRRLIAWLAAAAAVCLVGGFAVIGNHSLRAAARAALAEAPPLVAVEPWQAAMTGWREAPVVGVGPGRASSALAAQGARSAERLAEDLPGLPRALLESGAIGLALVAGAWLALLWLGARRWLQAPFYEISAEAAYRMDLNADRAGGRGRRRRVGRRHRRYRAGRYLVGGSWLGLLLLVLGAALTGAGGSGVVLVSAALLAAFLLLQLQTPEIRLRHRGWAPLLLPLGMNLLLGFALVRLPLLARAQEEAFLARRALTQLSEAESPAEPEAILAAQRAAERAVALEPRHSAAWVSLAEACWREAALARRPPAEVGDRVVTASERALALDPDDAAARFWYAQGRALSGAPLESVRSDYESAIAAAPGDVSYRIAMAEYLFRQRQPDAEVAAVVDSVLERDPRHAAALRLRARLEVTRMPPAPAGP